MKPRIKLVMRIGSTEYWKCEGYGALCIGPSPMIAYRKWDTETWLLSIQTRGRMFVAARNRKKLIDLNQ